MFQAPDFSARMTDQRAQQNDKAEFSCTVKGEPKPAVNWFKVGEIVEALI